MPTQPSEFRAELRNGRYTEPGSARKAIAKMKSWTEEEKDAARASVDRKFGSASTKPPVKKATKKATRVGHGPGTGRKKKAAKKPGRPAAVATAAAEKVVKAVGRVTGKDVEAQQPPTQSDGEPTIDAHLRSAQGAVQIYSDAISVLEKCKIGDVDVETGLKSAAEGITSLLAMMERTVVSPLAGAEVVNDELFKKARASAVLPTDPPPVAPQPPVAQVVQQPVAPLPAGPPAAPPPAPTASLPPLPPGGVVPPKI